MEISISTSFTPNQLESITGGEHDPFRGLVYGLVWRPTEWHVTVREDGLEVCHIGLVAHTVEVNGRTVKVAGVGGVITKREYRGRGIGVAAMRTAESVARQELDSEFMLLFCRPGMRGWYETQNWALLRDTVLVDQPGGAVPAPLLAMVKQLGATAWPAGDVRLNSLPW
jgi:GNAT superfamily N-acetyltransferase